MEDFTPALNSVIDITEQRFILKHRYLPVYFLLQAYGYQLKRQELPKIFEIQVN